MPDTKDKPRTIPFCGYDIPAEGNARVVAETAIVAYLGIPEATKRLGGRPALSLVVEYQQTWAYQRQAIQVRQIGRGDVCIVMGTGIVDDSTVEVRLPDG